VKIAHQVTVFESAIRRIRNGTQMPPGQAGRLLLSSEQSVEGEMNIGSLERKPLLSMSMSMSTPPGQSGDDSDDLDDLLDETGEIANRSNGKTGTYTEAEPDPKPKQE
jgi:hypothetical protein